jgi:hypothetical protein
MIASHNADTTHTMPHLPAEIWAAIFAYTNDPILLWTSYRPMCRSLKAGVEVHFTTIVIPNYLRITYSSPYIEPNGLDWCDRTTFLCFSPDRRLAYFNLTSVPPTTQVRQSDKLFVVVVKRHMNDKGGQLEVVAHLGREETDMQYLSPRYPIKAIRACDADLVGVEGVEVLVELNVEQRILGLDWQVVMRQIFRNRFGKLKGCVWGREWVAAISG